METYYVRAVRSGEFWTGRVTSRNGLTVGEVRAPVLARVHLAACGLVRKQAGLRPRDFEVWVTAESGSLCEEEQVSQGAWGSVWLHGKWSWLTRCMTTLEREYAAGQVQAWSDVLNASEDGDELTGELEGLRWWRTG